MVAELLIIPKDGVWNVLPRTKKKKKNLECSQFINLESSQFIKRLEFCKNIILNFWIILEATD